MADNKENEEKAAIGDGELESPEVHFEPLVKLSLVETKTMEENEEVILQLRAKLFRYDTDCDPNEWKERGVGDCRILKHRVNGHIRILMRRDKTLKICCNHYINPSMELKPNCGSDRAWVWSTSADYADEELKEEVLAIRFGNSDNAQKFKTVFDESRSAMKKFFENSSPAKKKEEVKENGAKKEDNGDEKEGEAKPEDQPEADQELSGQLKELSVTEG